MHILFIGILSLLSISLSNAAHQIDSVQIAIPSDCDAVQLECCICHDKPSLSLLAPYRYFKCTHAKEFHDSCIQSWMQKCADQQITKTCPICRAEVRDFWDISVVNDLEEKETGLLSRRDRCRSGLKSCAVGMCVGALAIATTVFGSILFFSIVYTIESAMNGYQGLW